MLRIAFASDDRTRVNQHFGSALGFVLYQVGADRTARVGYGEFREEAMDGNENKLAAKVDFLDGCAAVFVMAIGGSAIKQLLARGIQPIRVTESDRIGDLLADLSRAMREGGVPWIERALAARAKTPAEDRFSRMEEEGWQG
jgi:nitrogen fixation protein NifX